MKIIISPAKKLTNEKTTALKISKIEFLNETKYLVNELKKYNLDDLQKLMGLSDSLAKINFERYKQWSLKSQQVSPAIFMFQGDVYKGLKADKFSEKELDFAQNNLRIISGLYGLIKPLDMIFPYRLEMGTHIETSAGNSLYNFWGDKLKNSLLDEMETEEKIVNLASNEYSKALKIDSIKSQVITPVFKDYKNGKLKVISFYAKKARGEMANYIIQNKITNPLDIESFSTDGYKFNSKDEQTLLFIR